VGFCDTSTDYLECWVAIKGGIMTDSVERQIAKWMYDELCEKKD